MDTPPEQLELDGLLTQFDETEVLVNKIPAALNEVQVNHALDAEKAAISFQNVALFLGTRVEVCISSHSVSRFMLFPAAPVLKGSRSVLLLRPWIFANRNRMLIPWQSRWLTPSAPSSLQP